MKAGMRRLASGVCVLSSTDGQGNRFAMTVSSVTSVSDSPASLLVCVNQETSMHRALCEGREFSISVLSQAQAEISNKCATGEQGESRFSGNDWYQSQCHAKIPYLQDAQAVFFCQQDKAFDYGTHRIMIGRIYHVLVSQKPVNPLIYVNGTYLKL